MMKKASLILLILALLASASCVMLETKSMKKAVKKAIHISQEQLLLQSETFDSLDYYPRSFNGTEYRKSKHTDWTCGFFPGTLWLEYQLTGDERIKDEALKYTARLNDIPELRGTHDLGFMVFCSYGKQYESVGDSTSAEAVVTAARTLAERFDPQVGLIRSWDFGKWNYPVIVDNMMNLEMMFWAAEFTGDRTLHDIAVAHADKTLANHFRDDYSSYHVVSYNNDGTVESRGTYQGYSDGSAWARGQAWGLYGYLVCYRYTQDPKYLEQAKHIAEYIMGNPAMPSDNVPYWDFNAPGTGNELCDEDKTSTVGIIVTGDGKSEPARDASAAAVVASALIEMYQVTEGEWADKCLNFARKTIASLCSPAYLAKAGTNGGFILMHSTGAASLGSEIDVPLNYADYYFLEAIARLKEIEGK